MAATPAQMLVLDSDHMSALGRGAGMASVLEARLANAPVPVAITIATVEEMMRGRLAQLARARDRAALITTYARLQETVEDLNEWTILPFDSSATSIYEQLRAKRLGIGTMDLRIASIVLANKATLLSRNLRDFQRVPDLSVEDWLS